MHEILRDLWNGKDVGYTSTLELEYLFSLTLYRYQTPSHMIYDRLKDAILIPKPIIESGIHFYAIPYSKYVKNEECIFNSTGDLIIGEVIIGNYPNLYDRCYKILSDEMKIGD